jgi:hypothetical protein
MEVLMDLNNTRVENGEHRPWAEYKNLITGWGRLIYYKQTGPNYFPGTNYFDPNDVENIEVYKVVETLFVKGNVLNYSEFNNAYYGRMFEHYKQCKVGFLAYDTTALLPELFGDGFEFNTSDDSYIEGVWDGSEQMIEETPVKDLFFGKW